MDKFFGLVDMKGMNIFLGDSILIDDSDDESLIDGIFSLEIPFSHVSKVVYNDKTFQYGVIIEEKGRLYDKGFVSFAEIMDRGQIVFERLEEQENIWERKQC